MQSSNFYFQASAVPASRFFPSSSSSSSSSCRAPSLSAPPAHALLLLLPHSLYLCPQLTLSSSASRRAPAIPAPADALLRLPPRSALPRAHAALRRLPLPHSLPLGPPHLAPFPPTRRRASTLLRGSPASAPPAPAPGQAASSSPGLSPGGRLLPSLGPRWGLGLPLCPLAPRAGPLLPVPPGQAGLPGHLCPLPGRSRPAPLPRYLGYPAPAHVAQLLLCPPAIRGAPCRSPAAAQRCPLPAASLASPLSPLAPTVAPCYCNHLPPRRTMSVVR